jgi:hypothetical protein
VQMNFPPQLAQQALEAENMTLASGTLETIDAAASAGKAASSTRTTEKAHVTQAAWPNGKFGKFRLFARVRTGGAKLKIRAITYGTGATPTPLTTGAIAETTSTTYVWLDLGDLVTEGGLLEIRCWGAAAGTVFVDRIEAFMMNDNASGGRFEGARDLAEACLTDSRTIPTLVTRSL